MEKKKKKKKNPSLVPERRNDMNIQGTPAIIGAEVLEWPSCPLQMLFSISTLLKVTLAVLWKWSNCYQLTFLFFDPPVGLKPLIPHLLVQPSTDWAPNLQPYPPPEPQRPWILNMFQFTQPHYLLENIPKYDFVTNNVSHF